MKEEEFSVAELSGPITKQDWSHLGDPPAKRGMRL